MIHRLPVVMTPPPRRQFRIEISKRAVCDLEEIYDYMVEHSPANADAVRLRLIAVIDSLAEMPLRFPRAPESRRYRREIRHTVESSYRVLYTVGKHAVHIITIRHGSRRVASDLTLE